MPARSGRGRDAGGVRRPAPDGQQAPRQTPQQTLRLSHPANPVELHRIRNHVGSWADRHALPEDVVIDLQLALGEAVANGVEHAYTGARPGTVDVEVQLRQDVAPAVLVRVSDHGRWRAPMGNGYRGRGLSVIERLARRVEVSRTRTGTEICFEIPL